MTNLSHTKEIGYVCIPPIFSIKLIYDRSTSVGTINFYNGKTVSFHIVQIMSISDQREECDKVLKYILASLFDICPRDLFQEEILKGNIQGLNFYDKLQVVRNKSGTIIWERP